MATRDSISGSVCYLRYVYLKNREGNWLETLLTALQRTYKTVYTDDEAGRAQSPLLRDLTTTKDFLYGGNLPFSVRRIVIGGFSVRSERFSIDDAQLVVTAYPRVGVISVAVGLEIRSASTEDFVFLRHMQGNGEPISVTFSGQTQTTTVNLLAQSVLEAAGLPLGNAQNFYLVELHDVNGCDNVPDLIEREPQRLYGILTGDEGWEYLPRELAVDRLSHRWSSREFVSVIAFGSGFLLLNLWDSPEAQRYRSHQDRFFHAYYGEMNPYFLLKSPMAGVNHGLFFAVEIGALIKCFSQSILDQQDTWMREDLKSFSGEIRRMKRLRRDLIVAINSVENVDMSEMGELQQLVMESLRIHPVMERLHSLLDVLESGLDLMYSTRTNFFVNILTVLGLVFSLIQVVGMFL
jgi:hypothetical protein